MKRVLIIGLTGCAFALAPIIAASAMPVATPSALGRTDEARAIFERLLGISNDLGLLAEEYDPTGKLQLGNFPQAFTHVCLVNTAHNLAGKRKPAMERAAQ